MRNGMIVVGVAFAVVLAVLIAQRLSNEAMAVVVGVVCGISASIPVSVGLVIAASRNWGRAEGYREIGYDYGAQRYAPQPPVVIISPPQPVQSAYGLPASPYYLPPQTSDAPYNPREFKIVGGEE